MKPEGWGSHSGGYEEFCFLGYNAVVVRWKSTEVSEETRRLDLQGGRVS
jgi:hypothetical protein